MIVLIFIFLALMLTALVASDILRGHNNDLCVATYAAALAFGVSFACAIIAFACQFQPAPYPPTPEIYGPPAPGEAR